MAKTNRTSPHKQQFEDEYEDFGYDVKNARRYQSNKKRTPKFRDFWVEEQLRSGTLVVAFWICMYGSQPNRHHSCKMKSKCNAVHHNIDWKNSNTSVTYCEESGESKVYPCNHIATVGDEFLQIFDGDGNPTPPNLV